MRYTIVETNINNIRPGDTVEIDGVLKTVCPKDIKTGGFCGTTLFGESYHGGRKPVRKADIYHAKPEIKGGQ